MGANDEWHPTMAGLLEPMVSVAAHPAPDFEEEQLYFVNYVQIPMPGVENGAWLSRWDGEGAVHQWRLDGIGTFDTIHDIKVTRDYVVFSDLPFVVEPGTFRGEPRKRSAQTHTQLYIVRKEDLRRTPPGGSVPVREVHIPIATGHLLVDYENPGGEIRVILNHIPAADLLVTPGPGEVDFRRHERMDPNYEGLPVTGLQPSMTGRVIVDAETGAIKDRSIAWDPDFWGGVLWSSDWTLGSSRTHPSNLFYGSMGWDPDIVPETMWRLCKDFPHTVIPMDDLPRDPKPASLARIDLDAMEYADVVRFDDGAFPHPPTFVPRQGATDDTDGYVVVILHKDGPKEVQVFDARNLAQGPIARATAPDFNPPLLLHSTYMPPRDGPRPSRYRVDLGRDLWGALKAFGPTVVKPATTIGKLAWKNRGRQRAQIPAKAGA